MQTEVCIDGVSEEKEVSPIRLVLVVEKATQDSCFLVLVTLPFGFPLEQGWSDIQSKALFL